MTMKTDTSRNAATRRSAEIDRRMAASQATGHQRAAERRRIEAEVDGEENAAQKAASERAEADAERGRIASVVKLGRDRDRGRQALRAALLAPIGGDAATGLIAALPTDAAASPEALAVPAFSPFGSPAAQAERRRIGSAFARPEAEGRFAPVCALVLVGDAGLTAEQIAPILATMPTEATKPKTPGPGERWQADVDAGIAVEMGGDYSPAETKSERIAAGWSKAVAEANASIGTGPSMSALGNGRPAAGLTSAARPTMEA